MHAVCVCVLVPYFSTQTCLAVIVQGVDVDLIELQRQIAVVVLKLNGFIQVPGPKCVCSSCPLCKNSKFGCQPPKEDTVACHGNY